MDNQKPPEEAEGTPRIWEVCQNCPSLLVHDRLSYLFKCVCSEVLVWADKRVWEYHYVPKDCPRIMETVVLGQEEDP